MTTDDIEIANIEIDLLAILAQAWKDV